MPDSIARKRLKKKMLERWENEGGKIATDTTSAEANRTTSEDKDHAEKLSSPRDHSTVVEPTSASQRRKPNRK